MYNDNGPIVISGSSPYPTKKSKKKWVILAAIILVLGAATTAYFLFFKPDPLAGPPNLRTIFDQSAPIPLKQSSGLYGYISPSSGNIIIEANFSYAERFYGDYAKVAMSNRRGETYSVINRKGKVVAEANSSDSGSVQYIIDQDIWQVGAVFYDGKMQRVTADGNESNYLGYGFIGVRASGKNGYSRILGRTGKEVFNCANIPCFVTIGSDFNGNGEFIAIVEDSSRSSILVDLQNGEEIMRLSPETSEYFVSEGNNLFSVKRAGDSRPLKTFLVYQGGIKKEFGPNSSPRLLEGQDIITISYGGNEESLNYQYYDVKNDSTYETIQGFQRGFKEYPSSDFIVTYCDNGYYGLEGKNGEILPCEYDNIINLPKNVFEYYSQVKKQDLFILFGGDVRLFNAKNKTTIRSFNNPSTIQDIQFFENSPFYIVGGNKIYSLGGKNGDGVDVSNYSDIRFFGNHFIIDNIIYGLDLNILNGRS